MGTSDTEWADAQALSNLPQVHEALQGFADDPTGDNGVMVVREVRRALAPVSGDVALPELQDVLAEWFNAVDGEHQAFWENQIAKRIRTYGQQCRNAALEELRRALRNTRMHCAGEIDKEHCVYKRVDVNEAIDALKGGKVQ